jgi:8-oxo-dGTP diphosphatase
MLAYTICFIRQQDRILLLNREHPSWMGAWNGVGGKIEANETPRESILREVAEETGIILDDVQFKGIVTWDVDGQDAGGMYVYYAELPADYDYETPIKTPEGILDWKKLDWILHPENKGVACNIPLSLEKIVDSVGCFEHRCWYRNGQLVQHRFFEIAEDVEIVRETGKGMFKEYRLSQSE